MRRCVFVLLLSAAACQTSPEQASRQRESDRGRAALNNYGCVSCHVIPGLGNARGHVGPALDALKQQSFIAGRLPNDKADLVRFIRFPREVDPETAMPNLGVSEADAAAIATYLQTH